MPQKLPIPVNIITGALGVGKTTAVQVLLRSKPADERWAVLVNEFGALGIDAALIEASAGQQHVGGGIVVKELAGGCLCCTLSGPLGVAIAQLVRQAKPDRLIIEPSGLGHPAGLLDTLYNEHLRRALDVKAIICLVDIAAAATAGSQLHSNETCIDQINVADVLVGNKADVATAEQTDSFWEWAEQLYPPKVEVLAVSQGQLDRRLLDLPRNAAQAPLFRTTHSSRRRAQQQNAARAKDGCSTGQAPAASAPSLPDAEGAEAGGEEPRPAPKAEKELAPGRPLRFPSGPSPPQRSPEAPTGSDGVARSGSPPSCGWLFSPDDVFDTARLSQLLQALAPAAQRFKGIFRTGKTSYVVPWVAPNGTVSLQHIAYRRESRFEVIAGDRAQGATGPRTPPEAGAAPLPPDSASQHAAEALLDARWLDLEGHLLACLRAVPPSG